MTFEQSKVFCSSNILRNLVNLAEKMELTEGLLESMENEMVRLLRYGQLKYPLTESKEGGRVLAGSIQEVDNMGLLAHNYFASGGLVFQWR